MLINTDLLLDVLAFFSRNELERYELVNCELHRLIQRYFPIKPYRLLPMFFIYLSSDCCLRCKLYYGDFSPHFLGLSPQVHVDNIDKIYSLVLNKSIRFSEAIFSVEMRYFIYKPNTISAENRYQLQKISHIWQNALTLRLYFDAYDSRYFNHDFEFYAKFAFEILLSNITMSTEQKFQIFVDGWEELFPLCIKSDYLKSLCDKEFDVFVSSNRVNDVNYVKQLIKLIEINDFNSIKLYVQFDAENLVELLKIHFMKAINRRNYEIICTQLTVPAFTIYNSSTLECLQGFNVSIENENRFLIKRF